MFTPGNVTGAEIDGTTPVVTFQLLVQNTSSTSLQLNSIAGNVTANGTLVGNISSFTPVGIMGNSTTPVQVQVRMLLLGLVNDILRAIQYNNVSQALELQGAANVDAIQVPLDLKFTVGPTPVTG